ncbi:C2H2-type domain-containing protein [Plasmodiophora brassicae]|nr:hypothetical protein PBRA_002493 [Plasmodiophora brassicae]
MTRGKAKVDAKIRASKKAEKLKRAGSELDAQKKGKKFECKICMTPVHNLQSMRDHYASKHPKAAFNESEFA